MTFNELNLNEYDTRPIFSSNAPVGIGRCLVMERR